MSGYHPFGEPVGGAAPAKDSPADQRVAALHHQSHARADRQRDLGLDMTEGQAGEAGFGAKAHRFELAAHRFEKAGLGDVVDRVAAEVVAGERAGPGDALRMREQAELQRGDVALADPARALLDAARDELPVDAV